MSTIGIAIIGCGGITLQNHLPGIALCAETKVTALCDSNPATLDAAEMSAIPAPPFRRVYLGRSRVPRECARRCGQTRRGVGSSFGMAVYASRAGFSLRTIGYKCSILKRRHFLPVHAFVVSLMTTSTTRF